MNTLIVPLSNDISDYVLIFIVKFSLSVVVLWEPNTVHLSILYQAIWPILQLASFPCKLVLKHLIILGMGDSTKSLPGRKPEHH